MCRVRLWEGCCSQLVFETFRISQVDSPFPAHKSPPLLPGVSQVNSFHAFQPCCFNIHFDIFHPSTPRSSKWSFSIRFPHQISLSFPHKWSCAASLARIDVIPLHVVTSGRDSSVGMATLYGLEGQGIESRWGEIFRTYPDRPSGPPSLLYNGYLVFPGGKVGRGVALTTHPLLVPR